MRELAQIHQSKLKDFKESVEHSYKYFEDNMKRYQDFMRFVFSTSLTANDISKLQMINKPALEFNVLEAYISRLRGEFAAQEPAISVRAADGAPPAIFNEQFTKTMDVLEGHMREILSSCKNDEFEYNIYSDTLAGGFSVAKVYTDYINEMSFEQCIHVERVFHPCLCGFDPLARDSHKGDGQYAFEIIPRTKKDFIKEFGAEYVEGMAFTKNVESFNWSYKNQDQEIVLVIDFYVKEGKKEKIIKLTNGRTIVKKHYEDLKEMWAKAEIIEQIPQIVDERETVLEKIVRYRFCENHMLDRVETDYKYLPLVFIDGNSVTVQDNPNNANYQMTRPYVYNAKGIQKLKNFAGQTIGQEMETMVHHKWIASIESIPEEYIEAYKNPQLAQTLAYNAFYNKNPDLPLPPPREVQRTPTPPIVEATFMGSDQVTQAILGSYDAQLGITNGQISGKAIQQGAIHSNSAALPYLVGYIKGLNRIATILLDLIPKYYVTPRSIPIRKANGLRSYQVINNKADESSINLNYDPNSLQVKVEAGVSTQLQKQIALDQIIKLSGASEIFAEFINTAGLETLLDNIDIRGAEKLKEAAMKFAAEKAKAAQENAGAPTPEEKLIEAETRIEMARIAQKAEEAEGNLTIKSGQLAVDEQKADIEFLRLMAELDAKETQDAIEAEKLSAEASKTAIAHALEVAEHNHKMRAYEDEMKMKAEQMQTTGQ